jgi:excinuclease UvrABC helicase subunit UvrB
MDMFEFFGKNNRKSLFDDFDKEFNEMIESFKKDFSTDLGIKEENVEEGKTGNMNWTKTTYSSPFGKITYIVSTTGEKTNSTPKTKELNEVSSLKKELELCVEKQDFERAVELRDKIKRIEEQKESIELIESELKKAVDEQDFESAIKFRDKLRKLKS